MDESAVDRVDALEQLGSRRFDLLVVGGGIVGAGIAEAASAHGLSVALVDKGDFGSATSSASSKLIHGGLRYLRLGDVGLVREAHHERRILMTVVAPHLVRRLPFLFPLYDDGPFRPVGRPDGDRALLDDRARAPERADRGGARAPAWCRSCAPKGCASARSTPTRGRTTAG